MDARDFSLRLTVALLLTGVLAGLVGIGFTHLLHAVQQWMFYGGWAAEHISFRELARPAAAGRRWRGVGGGGGGGGGAVGRGGTNMARRYWK